MEKNKTYTILLVILLSIIAIAIIGTLIVILTNSPAYFGKWSYNRKSLIIYEKTYSSNDFQQIQIDVTSTDLTVKPSDNDEIKIVIYGTKEDNANSIIENDTLMITKNTKNQFCFGFCFYNKDEIVLYLPSEIEITLTATTQSGDIKVGNFENVSLNLETSSGDIEIGTVKDVELVTKSGDVKVESSNRTKIQTRSGDIEVSNIQTYADCKTSSGDVKIGIFQIVEDSTIQTASGDVLIHQITDSYIDTKTRSGDIRIKENNRFSEIELHIETSSGDITVK